MDLKLQGKTAIVTGGSAGIGLGIAKALANEGVSVVVPGRSKERLDKALDGLTGVKAVEADVATAAGVTSLTRQFAETDILINNLGIYERKHFTDISDEDWLRLFEVNVLSGVRLSRHYFPGMLSRNWGRVIFVSSESGVMTPVQMIHYGMTKSSQLAISRGMAELTKGTAVTVNSVLPGPTRSENNVEFLKDLVSPNATSEELEKEFFEKHRSGLLLQRLLENEEIANLVAYLASPLSSATNGAAVRAEGGSLQSII